MTRSLLEDDAATLFGLGGCLDLLANSKHRLGARLTSRTGCEVVEKDSTTLPAWAPSRATATALATALSARNSQALRGQAGHSDNGHRPSRGRAKSFAMANVLSARRRPSGDRKIERPARVLRRIPPPDAETNLGGKRAAGTNGGKCTDCLPNLPRVAVFAFLDRRPGACLCRLPCPPLGPCAQTAGFTRACSWTRQRGRRDPTPACDGLCGRKRRGRRERRLRFLLLLGGVGLPRAAAPALEPALLFPLPAFQYPLGTGRRTIYAMGGGLAA